MWLSQHGNHDNMHFLFVFTQQWQQEASTWSRLLNILTRCYSALRSAPSTCEPMIHRRSVGPCCSAVTQCIWWSLVQRCDHPLYDPAWAHGLHGNKIIHKVWCEKSGGQWISSCLISLWIFSVIQVVGYLVKQSQRWQDVFRHSDKKLLQWLARLTETEIFPSCLYLNF